jgi:hypothetical protein
MLTRTLIIIDWTLWSVLVGALGYALLTLLLEKKSPSATRLSLGVVLVGFGLLFALAIGLLLHWLTQMPSLTGLVILMLLLAWPLGPLAKQYLAALIQRNSATAHPGSHATGAS